MLLLLEKQRDIPYIKILKSLQAIIGALTLCEIFLISKLSTHFSTTPNHRGGGAIIFSMKINPLTSHHSGQDYSSLVKE